MVLAARRVLDRPVARDKLLVLAALRGALPAVALFRGVADDLRGADLRERVLLSAAPLLLLHHVRYLWHLTIVGGPLYQFIDVVLQVLVVRAADHRQGRAVTLTARRIVLRTNGAGVLAAPHLLESLLRIVHAREQGLVSLRLEMEILLQGKKQC